MNKQTYPIILQQEADGGYSVTNLALEGCYSEGDTIEESLENIKEATLLCLEDEQTSNTIVSPNISLHMLTV